MSRECKCANDGLVLLRDGDDDLGYGVCLCAKGDRLRRVLMAIARGEPVRTEHALDHPKAYEKTNRTTALAQRITPYEE